MFWRHLPSLYTTHYWTRNVRMTTHHTQQPHATAHPTTTPYNHTQHHAQQPHTRGWYRVGVPTRKSRNAGRLNLEFNLLPIRLLHFFAMACSFLAPFGLRRPEQAARATLRHVVPRRFCVHSIIVHILQCKRLPSFLPLSN